MRLTRRTFLLGSGSASLLALGGCGGDEASGVTVVTPATAAAASTPTPTPSPTPTPTPTATPAPLTGVVVEAGDSIGAGYAVDGYAAIDHLGFGAGVAIHNGSVSGRTMNTGYAQRGADLFVWYDPGETCVLLIEQGTNDLGLDARSAASLYDDLAAPFVAAAKRAGFYVALNTVLPRSDGGWDAGREAQRLLYNTMVRANAAGADAINDVAADPLMGDGVNTDSSAYYIDKLHPTVLGQQRLATLDAAVLAPLLALPPRAAAG